jgi:hypothetical protein
MIRPSGARALASILLLPRNCLANAAGFPMRKI